MKDLWDEDSKKIHKPEYDYILQEIDKLFDLEKLARPPGKNLVLMRIYLPERDFRLMQKMPEFERNPSLGGIPVSMIYEDKIRIDTEFADPRKRKKRTVVYVRKDSSV